MAAEFAGLFSGPKGKQFLERLASEAGITTPQSALDHAGRTDPYELAERKGRREIVLLVMELAGAKVEIVVAPSEEAPRQGMAQSS